MRIGDGFELRDLVRVQRPVGRSEPFVTSDLVLDQLPQSFSLWLLGRGKGAIQYLEGFLTVRRVELQHWTEKLPHSDGIAVA